MLLIPYRSDTLMEYRPYLTFVAIGINILVFCVINLTGDVETFEKYSLTYNDGIQPIQWVSSAFLHMDFAHLLGNMIFLYAFGSIVEGEVGQLPFSLIYFVAVIVVGCLEQIIFYGQASGSVGASSVIYAFMAVTIIWVPHNQFEVMGLWFRPFFFEIKIMWLALIYIALDIIFFDASSVLHILGVLVGFPIAILFLKKGWVDPQGWDFFSIYFKKKIPKKKDNKTKDESIEKDLMIVEFNKCVAAKSIEEALFLFENNLSMRPKVKNNLGLFFILLYDFNKEKFFKYVESSLSFIVFNKDRVLLRLASYYLENEKNKIKCAEILKSINMSSLTSSEMKTFRVMEAKLGAKDHVNDSNDDPLALQDLN